MLSRLVAVGTSLGGLDALEEFLSRLPADLRAPVVIVQHRAIGSRSGLVESLRQYSGIPLIEPDDKTPLASGCGYLAPPDYHLMVERGWLGLSTSAPVNFARPSIDVLMESAADAYGHEAIAVLLTGASRDGAAGALRIRDAGGLVIAQDPAEAVCPVMPRAVIELGIADRVLPLVGIARELARICGTSS